MYPKCCSQTVADLAEEGLKAAAEAGAGWAAAGWAAAAPGWAAAATAAAASAAAETAADWEGSAGTPLHQVAKEEEALVKAEEAVAANNWLNTTMYRCLKAQATSLASMPSSKHPAI
jgi:hypothetical protein